MRMPTHRLGHPNRDTVILGPCPGCSVWTLQYDNEVRASYAEVRYEEIYELASEDPVEVIPFVDASGWERAVESVLQDHYDECYGLRKLVEDA